MFWEIWGLRKLSNQILVLGQSRTKTSTKTHLTKSRNTYPKDHLLVQNLQTTNPKKHEKKVSWAVKDQPQCNFCCRNSSLKAEVCTPVSQQCTVPRVCRKWVIPFSLVEARTEIWKFYFGRITYRLVWATKLLLAAIGLVFPALRGKNHLIVQCIMYQFLR